MAAQTAKQKLALSIIERLKKEYPDAECSLEYDDAWKLLVSVRLAAQCTDARVNVVVQELFAKYRTPAELADASVEDIERIVKPCGLGHSKAKDISACMKMLCEKYDGKVPRDFEALLSLPGVGRKCVRRTGHRYGYPLHPAGKQNGACRWNKGSKEGGNGALEADTSTGRQRFLSSSGVSRKGGLHRKDGSLLRKMLSCRSLQKAPVGVSMNNRNREGQLCIE